MIEHQLQVARGPNSIGRGVACKVVKKLLGDFLAGIYERSRSHRMRPTVKDTADPHDCILSLPGAEEFPLW